MYFAQYQYLYLLLLVPVILIGYGVLRTFRRKRVRRFGEEELVGALMPSWSGAKGWVRTVLFALAFACFAIGLARPQTGAKLAEHKSKGVEIMVALDVSNSMLSEDYSPNRLERAKLAISRLTDKLQDDRIGLVIFAGTPFVQLPVTTDYVSAKMFLSSITPGSVPVQGTAIGEAILLSIKSFSAQSEKSRVIVVISDGENHEDDAVEAAKQAAEYGIRVYTIGVGSPEGQPIPVDGELPEGQGRQHRRVETRRGDAPEDRPGGRRRVHPCRERGIRPQSHHRGHPADGGGGIRQRDVRGFRRAVHVFLRRRPRPAPD